MRRLDGRAKPGITDRAITSNLNRKCAQRGQGSGWLGYPAVAYTEEYPIPIAHERLEKNHHPHRRRMAENWRKDHATIKENDRDPLHQYRGFTLAQ